MKKFSCVEIDSISEVFFFDETTDLFFKTIHESVRKAIEVLEAVSQRSMELVTPGVRV